MDRAVAVAVKVGMFSLVAIFSPEKQSDLETDSQYAFLIYLKLSQLLLLINFCRLISRRKNCV